MSDLHDKIEEVEEEVKQVWYKTKKFIISAIMACSGTFYQMGDTILQNSQEILTWLKGLSMIYWIIGILAVVVLTGIISKGKKNV